MFLTLLLLLLLSNLDSPNWRVREDASNRLISLNRELDLRETLPQLAEKYKVGPEAKRRLCDIYNAYYCIGFPGDQYPMMIAWDGEGNKTEGWIEIFQIVYHAQAEWNGVKQEPDWVWRSHVLEPEEDSCRKATKNFVNELFRTGKNRQEVIAILNTMIENEKNKNFFWPAIPEELKQWSDDGCCGMLALQPAPGLAIRQVQFLKNRR